MPDLDAQRRAYELLQWVPYSLPTEFNEDLAADGYYTKTQKQRSDAALTAFDAAANARSAPPAGAARSTPDQDRAREELARPHAEQSRRARSRARRQRR